jgi:uncharacterized protein (DUF983 family)
LVGVKWLLDQLSSIDPLKESEELRDIILKYLKPRGGPAKRAHLFTINGLTYPIHRDYCFAAVPDPHEIRPSGKQRTLKFSTQRSKRRYSMLAYLHSVRPGDLIFYFQADPQWPKDIWNRRGFRGIWTASSPPFRDVTTVKHPTTGYEELGKCPHCGTPFNFGEGKLQNNKKCPICGQPYGKVNVQGAVYSRVVLSARLLTQPVVVFKRTAGDNRVYSDMSVEPLIWISRTDNAMGPGKGSSIRTLLPEEAAKIAFMLATEDDQEIEEVECLEYPGQTNHPIDDYNGKPFHYLRAKRIGGTLQLEHEFHLNLYFSLLIDDPNSPIIRELKIPLDKVEYWTTEFPWGYTGDTADFVLTLWDDNNGRYAVYIFEFKKDRIDRMALAEVLLYIPWVVQVLTQFRHETKDVTVYPVLVGNSIALRAVPESYSFSMKFFTSPSTKNVTVESPILLRYSIRNAKPFKDPYRNGETIYYVHIRDLDLNKVRVRVKPFTPPPPLTFTTADVERQYVADKYLQGF